MVVEFVTEPTVAVIVVLPAAHGLRLEASGFVLAAHRETLPWALNLFHRV